MDRYIMIKRLYRKLLPSKVRGKLRVIKIFFTDKQKFKQIRAARQHNVSYGKLNKDKHFFVCRRDAYATGLLSCYLHALGHLIDNNDKIQEGKIIPVMDMYTQHFNLIHNCYDGVLKINAWDYYFKPFSNYSMSEVLQSKYVTLSYAFLPESAKPFFHSNELNKDIIRRVLPIHNRYLHLNDDLSKRFYEKYSSIFKGKRILGTNIREGYIVLANERDNESQNPNMVKIEGHPRQPSIDELCFELDKKMKEWGCDYLYAEYETTFVEEKLKQYFGDRFLHNERLRNDTGILSLNAFSQASQVKKSKQSMVDNNIKYLESIYLLSKCTSLYSPKSSGTVVAALWNNDKYEHIEIINEGTY